MRPMLVMCSAASWALIFVVIAESFTNAGGCERSASESSAARITAGPSSVPKTTQVVANVIFMCFPHLEADAIVLLASILFRSLSHQSCDYRGLSHNDRCRAHPSLRVHDLDTSTHRDVQCRRVELRSGHPGARAKLQQRHNSLHLSKLCRHTRKQHTHWA